MHIRSGLSRDVSGIGGVAPARDGSPPWPSHHRAEALSNNLYNTRPKSVAAAAKENATAAAAGYPFHTRGQQLRSLYTPEQRARRDATHWTLVQAILAPVQFAVFLISAVLVARYLLTGAGFDVATMSIVAKTLLLYAIMVTGSIWEREVFGVYLFADAFFWEDVFSFIVLALHTAYLVALFAGVDPQQQMLIAIAAYASYLVNATQFLLKLRAARRDEHVMQAAAEGAT